MTMIIQNIGDHSEDELYLAFPGEIVNETVNHIALLEVRGKTSDDFLLKVVKAEFDSER